MTDPPQQCAFTVEGIPVTQAGTRQVDTAQGPRQISTGGKHLQAWRNKVTAQAIKTRYEHGPLKCPVAVTVQFRFPMPDNRTRAEKTAGTIPKAVRPDLDKLCRAVGDSLQAGGLIYDDSNIVEWHATKVEVFDAWTGAAITVTALGGATP